MSRRRKSGSDAVNAYLQEAATMARPGRGVRETAVVGLRFFAPLNPALRTLPALLQLRDEFGAELSEASWLHRQIAELEAKQ